MRMLVSLVRILLGAVGGLVLLRGLANHEPEHVVIALLVFILACLIGGKGG